MAGISGGIYITFGKPYLTKVAKLIGEGLPLIFSDGSSEVVLKTSEIKTFLHAVDIQNELLVKTTLMEGSGFKEIFNGRRWTQIEKGQFTGKGGDGIGAADAKSTMMQEKASLFAIQKGIEANGYSDKEKFYKLYRTEMMHIYPDMNEDWENTFFQQQVTAVRELGKSKFDHYSRDEGFMEWITKFVKDKYNITKKDSWNPADIWLIHDYENVKRLLKQKILDDVTPIQEFNAILRDMWYEKKIIGISLKKMSGKVAKWELVNLKDMDMFDDDTYTFKLDEMICDLSTKGNDFKTSDTKIRVKSKNQSINFQIRQNSTGMSNLKIEATDPSATSARLGKAPLDMVAKVFNEFGLEFDNKNQNFPKNSSEFEKSYATWKSIFNSVKSYTNVSTEEKFKMNMISVYNSKRPDFAHSKLMQLKLIYQINKLSPEKRDKLLTDLAYVAQKKGSVFGPFGKLY